MKQTKVFCLTLLAVLLALAGHACAEKTMLLTFTGDCTIGGKEEGRGMPGSFEYVAKQNGYDYFFADFKEMFEQDDQTVINFEGVFSDNSWNEKKKKHAFRGAKEFVQILTGSGIDAASLSNNHILDYNTQGQKTTRATLEENGIAWFQDFHYYLYEKDGAKVALFALQNSVLYSKSAKFYEAVRTAREEDGAAAVIVCWHTGTEYKRYHNKETEDWVKTLVDNGVDLVIINHPHVAQGMGVFNNRSVFYSLGNFVFGGNHNIRGGKNSRDPLAISLYSLVVQAKLTFTNDGKYLGQQITAYPVFSSGADPDYQVGDKQYPANNYQPIRLTVEQAQPIYEILTQDSTFQIPEMREKDGFAEISFPYLPAFDGIMLPEDSDTDASEAAVPVASNPKPTKDGKNPGD